MRKGLGLFAIACVLTGHLLAQPTEQWVTRYEGPALVYDEARAMTADQAGNVYVTGYSCSAWVWAWPDSGDYVTVKYDARGVRQWVVRYNGPADSTDRAAAIAVDNSGNVYVTGASVGSGRNLDYATVKYDAAGTQQWVARYNGPMSPPDENKADAIAVDARGNVYVTGSSKGSWTNYDYATVKYDPAGVRQWVARYDGPASSDDEPRAIAIDRAANVYVTGYSYSTGPGGPDCLTIKYDSAGAEQWRARYDGPAAGADGASAIAIDGSGNVYIAGWSAGPGTGRDFVTVKYDSTGTQTWASYYDGTAHGDDSAAAIAVDRAGNVYVTGMSLGSRAVHDYATVMYDSGGVRQWVARYDGSAGWDDEAVAIAVDDSGIYVTGGSTDADARVGCTTVKYDRAGIEQWVARYTGPGGDYARPDRPVGLALDNAGHVFVAGSSWGVGTGTDYATVAYSRAGIQEWVDRYNSPQPSGETALGLAVDDAGSVYVTGESMDRLHSYYATVKYRSDGATEWSALYNGPGNGWNTATAVAVDHSGNAYVTGASMGLYGSLTYATIKYDAIGTEQWVARYRGAYDMPNALAVDRKGNAYIAGRTAKTGYRFDYATVKYDSTGNQWWAAEYDGPVQGHDEATALAIDDAENVYVTGNSSGPGSGSDYATVKYNWGGVQQWVARYNGPGNGNDQASAIAVDNSGNVCVTGTSTASATGLDYLTIKYRPDGTPEWTARYDGPGDGEDRALAIALDGAGNVYVAGSSLGLGSGLDYTTIKYDAAGNRRWAVRYDGPGSGDDIATAITVDRSGNTHVTGRSQGNGSGFDYATVKYSPLGIQEWVARYNGPGNDDDGASHIVLDLAGRVIVTGSSIGLGTGPDFATIAYETGGGAVVEPLPPSPATLALRVVAPNPTRTGAAVHCAAPAGTVISITVRDVTGRLVTVLARGRAAAGGQTVRWDGRDARGRPAAPGIYFILLVAGDRSITAKVVKMD